MVPLRRPLGMQCALPLRCLSGTGIAERSHAGKHGEASRNSGVLTGFYAKIFRIAGLGASADEFLTSQSMLVPSSLETLLTKAA
jgi:hypothetical protein